MKVLSILCLVALVSSKDEPSIGQQWQEFKLKFHGGGLTPVMELMRFGLFQLNMAIIKHLNNIQDDWTAGATQFADMTQSERATYNGDLKMNMNMTVYRVTGDRLTIDHVSNHYASGSVLSGYLPGPLDPSDPFQAFWEMGPVKNQMDNGGCGSCWALTAASVLEGRHLKEHGEYRDFSEQTLIDCTYEGVRDKDGWVKDGCDGGNRMTAINWAGKDSPISKSNSIHHGYLPLRADNKYTARDGECTDLRTPYPNALRRAKPAATYLAPQNDAALQHALATEGPVAVGIYGTSELEWYRSGTYTGTGCPGAHSQWVLPSGYYPTDHAVTVVGYTNVQWYIKNTWGTDWGHSGYAYFTRKSHNLCGISSGRIHIEWNPNPVWDQCRDTPPSERTICGNRRYTTPLAENICLAHGCCYDATYQGTHAQCFMKGKITIYDGMGRRRVLYGSANEFSQFEFSYRAKAARVEAGTWFVYTRANYQERDATDGGYHGYHAVTAADGWFSSDFQSVKIVHSSPY